jgi:hypothetical protein
MRLRSRFARGLAASTLTLALAACTPPLDTDSLEDTLMDKVSQDTRTTITTVDCPDVKAEAGSTFECTATDDEGIEFVLKVTQTDDQGHVVFGYVDAEAPGSASPTP